MRRLAAAAALVLVLAAGAALARNPAVAGDKARVTFPSPACRDMGEAREAEAIRQQGDAQAFTAYMLPRPQCRLLTRGLAVYVMESAIWQGMARVRAEGSAESYWVIDAVLERSE